MQIKISKFFYLFNISNLNLNFPLRRRNYQKKKNINRGLREYAVTLFQASPKTKYEDVDEQRVQNTRPSTTL